VCDILVFAENVFSNLQGVHVYIHNSSELVEYNLRVRLEDSCLENKSLPFGDTLKE
jgi:hypothetical protein